MKAELIYFSATGTTRKIGKALAEGLGCEVHYTDITRPQNRICAVQGDFDLAVMAAPIYGERIPKLIYEYFQKSEGGGKPLVTVSVYGNMGYGISLEQFSDLAKRNHFRLIGAGAFIGEHTYANEKLRVAYGRPNEHDLAQAREFGRQIRAKMDKGLMEPVCVPKSVIPKFITRFPDSGTRLIIRQPLINGNLCNRCGACAKLCPTGVIDADSLKINEQKCLRCYGCVKGCPKSARTARFRFALLGKGFAFLGRKRKENLVIV